MEFSALALPRYGISLQIEGDKMAKKRKSVGKAGEDYRHLASDLPLRPEIGIQAQFRKKPPKTYKYDPSLSPALEWDGQTSIQ